jgi:hypothetical protein
MKSPQWREPPPIDASPVPGIGERPSDGRSICRHSRLAFFRVGWRTCGHGHQQTYHSRHLLTVGNHLNLPWEASRQSRCSCGSGQPRRRAASKPSARSVRAPRITSVQSRFSSRRIARNGGATSGLRTRVTLPWHGGLGGAQQKKSRDTWFMRQGYLKAWPTNPIPAASRRSPLLGTLANSEPPHAGSTEDVEGSFGIDHEREFRRECCSQSECHDWGG